MASYADFAAPPEAMITLQGIFGALFEGIGNRYSLRVIILFSQIQTNDLISSGTSIGSLLGGFVFEAYGGAIMFRSFGVYALIYGIIYSICNLAIDYHRRKSSSQKYK